ncbi:MAG: hypothetical protein ACKOFE_10080, partial [Bacteroidota bacterium]
MVPIILGILVGLSMGSKTRAQAPHQLDLNLQEALQRAQATWAVLKVDSLNILAAQRERRAHPM